MHSLHRRDFLRTAAASAASLSALTAAGAADQPNDKLLLAVIGVHGRGRDLLQGFAAFDDVEVAYVCDPDSDNVGRSAQDGAEPAEAQPKVEKDLRRVLEDKDVDAVVVATPDHWHALATVWACQAGKHVYVEKPVSHNLVEGRRMVEAARKYDRVVQVGTQRRSGAHFQSAAEFVRSGKLGKVPFAQAWIAGDRKSIGHKPDADPPAGVDYDLWLGPAPERPFNPNRFHYNWHWNWDYGTGEIGNNGIHGLDVVRWVLGLDAPARVTSGGGKLFYDDDQQTPDTQVVAFDFPGTTLVVGAPHLVEDRLEGDAFGIALYGEKGTLVFDKKGWHVQDGAEGVGQGVRPRAAAPAQLPRLRQEQEAAQRGHRGGAQEHAALPPGQHRLPRRPGAQVRRRDGDDRGRRRGERAAGRHLSQAVRAAGDGVE